MSEPDKHTPPVQIQCMEVWGGSRLTAQGVEFGGLEAWVTSTPYGEAEDGGDVYYASSCGTGRITRLLLADVSGHGQAVAAAAADLRTLMRQFVNHIDQAEFVGLLNRQFGEMSRAGTFATAIVATFFSPSRRLTICNAGHPCPLLYRAAERKWSLLRHTGVRGGMPKNTPLGLIRIAEYEQFDIELAPGDWLVCCTDALMESNDADGQMLGEEGVLKLVRRLTDPRTGPADPAILAEGLLEEIRLQYPGNLTDDDVTVMAVRANGRDLRFSVREQAHAAARLATAVLKWGVGGGERPPLPDWNLANLGGALIPALGRRWTAKRAN